MALFPIERSIFNRENAAGMYGPLTFYLGRSLAEMPQHIILLLFQGVTTYLMYGFQMDGEKMLVYCVLVMLTGTAGAGLLLFCSAITKTFEQANLATFIILLLMLFDGMFVFFILILFVFIFLKIPQKNTTYKPFVFLPQEIGFHLIRCQCIIVGFVILVI